MPHVPIRSVLTGLAHSRLLRVREVDGLLRVKRPDAAAPAGEDEPEPGVCVVDPVDDSWRDETLGTTGRGIFSLGQHLRLPLEAILAAMR